MIEDLAYKTVKGYTQIEFGNYAALRKSTRKIYISILNHMHYINIIVCQSTKYMKY